MFTNSFYKGSVTPIPKPDKDNIKKNKKRKLQANMPDEHRCTIFNKLSANRIQQYIESIINHDQVGFILGIQGWFEYPQINQYYIPH